MKKVGVIGLGLIGGSFAISMREQYEGVELIGLDVSESHRKQALDLGWIDAAYDVKELNMLKTCDMVFLAVPVTVICELVCKVLDTVEKHTLVVDAGSTKQEICRVVKDHPNRAQFLACHPIAGTEFSGPEAALEGLYKDKTMIICEVEATAFKLQEKAVELFRAIGMRIRYMNAKSHDKHIAYVSHLSHISSFMLGKTVIEKEKNENDIFDMAGSGFESTVRLAKSSPAMWTPIFAENKSNVIEALEEYISNLTAFKKLMEDDAYEAVFNEMEQTNKIKEILNGIPHNN